MMRYSAAKPVRASPSKRAAGRSGTASEPVSSIVETADIGCSGLVSVRQVTDACGQRAVRLPGFQRLLRGIVELERPVGTPLDQGQGAEMDVGADPVGQPPPARVDGPADRRLLNG